MKNYYEDKTYIELVEDILNNKEFQKLKHYKHHGINRLTHSMNVSYHSYRITKFLKLNYKAAARAGLLHDFFLVNYQKINSKEKIKVLCKHPVYAFNNSKKNFDLSPIEENIILSHMFPLHLTLPKYVESIIVHLVDDFLPFYERFQSIVNKDARFSE
ncbi:hydrolase [bacterium]|nr:hydrolase [bacterium]